MSERTGITTVPVLSGATDRKTTPNVDVDTDYVLESLAGTGEVAIPS